LRQEFLPRFMAWRRIVEGGVRDAFAHHQLTLPFSADAIACWIVDFWVGMEFEMLLGVREDEAHHHEALDAMQRLLEELDARASVARADDTESRAANPTAQGEHDDHHRTDNGED